MKQKIITVNMKDKFQVYIALGSNLEDRELKLKTALEEIAEVSQIKKRSNIIETEPVGYTNQGKFLNMAIEVETTLSPMELLIKLQEIEHKLGRVRDIKYGPRTIDLDIIFYEDKIINQPHLQIPHPEMHKRRFVLVPLAEIAPEIIHPVERKTISYLLDECKDSTRVKRE